MSTIPPADDVVIDIDADAERTVVSVVGELDVRTVPTLRRTLFDPDVTAAPLLVVDLTGVDFIDSIGIGALVAARRWVGSRGAEMQLICAESQPLRVLRTMGLQRVFDIVYPALPAVV